MTRSEGEKLLVAFVASVLSCAALVVGTASLQHVRVSLSFEGKLPAVESPVYLGARPEVVCSVTSMECVDMAIYGTAAARRFSTPRPPERTGPALKSLSTDDPNHFANVQRALLAKADLTELHMFAMMRMSSERRHQAIWHFARERLFDEAPFTGAAFYQLKDKGLAYKPEGKNFHLLTEAAMPLADAVAAELVKRHSIHAAYILHRREDSMHSKFFCTCGWGKTLAIGGNMQVKLHNAFLRHMTDIEAVKRLADAVKVPHTTDEG